MTSFRKNNGAKDVIFLLFEKSGHNPQVEEPSALFNLIREFLRK
jgi:pimeloyl-ACP methyl ester carboxylesterase